MPEAVGGVYTPSPARTGLEPSERTMQMVENTVHMRPDMWKSTLKRFEGNEERAKKWLGGYLQFWMNQVKDMIENAGKMR